MTSNSFLGDIIDLFLSLLLHITQYTILMFTDSFLVHRVNKYFTILMIDLFVLDSNQYSGYNKRISTTHTVDKLIWAMFF